MEGIWKYVNVLFYNYHNRPTKPNTCNTNMVEIHYGSVLALGQYSLCAGHRIISGEYCALRVTQLLPANVECHIACEALLILCASISQAVLEPHELCLHVLQDAG
jgi:hypothetical protein